MAINVTCDNCGKPFKAERSTARFCSGNCRVEFSRKGTKKGKAPAKGSPASKKASNPPKFLEEMAKNMVGDSLMAKLKDANQQNVSLLKRNEALEQELVKLKAQLQQQKAEKGASLADIMKSEASDNSYLNERRKAKSSQK